tara:strand:- start:162 stop:416 length:255 start_codon:yes stop_codon:yes gene_type:complete
LLKEVKYLRSLKNGTFFKEYIMPIATINIIEGRSDEQKEKLIEKVTQAIHEAIDAPKQNVRVILNEMPKQHFGIGGESVKKMGR